jgi:broad specificity phosphatase PhoE
MLRHADCGRAGCFVGSTDVSLSEAGLAQTRGLSEMLRSRKIQRAFCSPAKRCIETAAALNGIQCETDADLREVDFGRWEGLTFDQIARRDPDLVERWAAFDLTFSFPGGESIVQFLERVGGAFQRACSTSDDSILWVTHGGVITATICRALGLDRRQHILFKIPHASVTTIELFDEMGILAGLGERA